MLNDLTCGTIQSFTPNSHLQQPLGAMNSFAMDSSNSLSLANSANVKVSSIEFINAHDQALIMAGYDDGCIRIWRPSTSNSTENTKESKLLTAWQAISDISYTKATSKCTLLNCCHCA